ncbi:hypothetical protein B0A52_08577 [Exophiala mesophila]|uniref:Major facilitator superfamily (MFS) profile domain-containing protein n=1 Tax=Exophiala mesophila TaxID=212818 RepID=A0A438MW87_EXOME|nr:hypothetical protein B0A52_08577 [Exophiala mesophila]
MADPSKAQEPIASHRESEHVDDTDTAKIEAAVDTVHNDEAMKVLASYSGPQDWTEEEEKVVRRKIDKRLLWILCVTYGLQYYDKSMLSQAAIFGLRTDLDLTGDRYSMSASIFYLGFIGGSYPAMWLMQHYAIEKVATAIVAVWGLCLALTAACHNFQALYAQRFFLGFFEAGVSPMFMMIVGQFYRKNEQAFRIGIWYCCTGGPPSAEQLGYIKFWLAFSISFLILIANGPASSFVPIIISQFGYDVFRSLLLTTPMGAVAGTMQLAVSYAAYKYSNIRSWLVIATEMTTIVAALLLWLLPRDGSLGALLFACYILCGFGAAYPILMGLTLANTAGYTKRTVNSAGIFIGYCAGNFLGPLLFKPQDAPRYASGFLTVVITGIVGVLLMVVYRYVCVWDNHRRDKSGVLEAYEHAYEDDLTDRKNPQFRYVL